MDLNLADVKSDFFTNLSYINICCKLCIFSHLFPLTGIALSSYIHMTDELSGSKNIIEKFEMLLAVIRIKVPVTIIIK